MRAVDGILTLAFIQLEKEDKDYSLEDVLNYMLIIRKYLDEHPHELENSNLRDYNKKLKENKKLIERDRIENKKLNKQQTKKATLREFKRRKYGQQGFN
jgi:hypothetical protein